MNRWSSLPNEEISLFVQMKRWQADGVKIFSKKSKISQNYIWKTMVNYVVCHDADFADYCVKRAFYEGQMKYDDLKKFIRGEDLKKFIGEIYSVKRIQ